MTDRTGNNPREDRSMAVDMAQHLQHFAVAQGVTAATHDANQVEAVFAISGGRFCCLMFDRNVCQ